MQPKSSKKFSDPDTQVLHLMKDPDDKENLLQNIPWHMVINYRQERQLLVLRKRHFKRICWNYLRGTPYMSFQQALSYGLIS